MLRIHMILLPVIAAALCLSPAASAQSQSVSGKITEINQKNNTVTIEPTSRGSGLPEKIELVVNPDTSLKGVNSLQDLNVGDEVRFEAQQQNTWFADSLDATAAEAAEETAEAPSEAPEEQADEKAYSEAEDKNIFQRAWGNIRSAWFSFTGDIGTNPDLYTEYAEKNISTSEKNLQELKSKASDPAVIQEYEREAAERSGEAEGTTGETGREAAREDAAPGTEEQPDTLLDSGETVNTAERKQALISDAETKLAAARGELTSLKQIPAYYEGIYSAENEAADAAGTTAGGVEEQKTLSDDWKDARGETDEALDDLRQSVQKAAGAILPQKERYEITSRYEIEEMKYNLEEIKAAENNRTGAANEEIRSRIQELEQTVEEADANHRKLEGSGGGDWKSIQDQLQNNFDSFRSVYSDVVAKLSA